MLEQLFIQSVHLIVRVIEVAGVAIIVVGAFWTLAAYLKRLAAGNDRDSAFSDFRRSLGRAILLGLEFLVAADIINTVAIEPTLGSVAVLAAIVAIRTFLSFSLETEIEGRWPWQRGPQRKGEA